MSSVVAVCIAGLLLSIIALYPIRGTIDRGRTGSASVNVSTVFLVAVSIASCGAIEAILQTRGSKTVADALALGALFALVPVSGTIGAHARRLGARGAVVRGGRLFAGLLIATIFLQVARTGLR